MIYSNAIDHNKKSLLIIYQRAFLGITTDKFSAQQCVYWKRF